MKILILSCNTGEGHNSAGKAIKSVFEKNGDECHITDALAFISPVVSRMIVGGHVFFYRYLPSLFHYIYDGAALLSKVSRGSGDTLIFRILSLGSKRLYRYIIDGGYDKIICVHPFASQMLTKLKRQHPEFSISTFFVATDYTCSPGVDESRLDHYIIPHVDAEADFVNKGIPTEKIRHIGIPINEAYNCLPSKSEARERLGISQNDRVALLVCGSMGCGPIRKIAEKMAKSLLSGMSLVVICGRNEDLRKKLSSRLKDNNSVRVLGYTNEMPIYMAASDLYVTKPGGLSTTESACAHLPMLMVDAVAGCETYNFNFFFENGYAFAYDGKGGAAELALELLSDDARLSEVRTRLAESFVSDGAYKIYKLVKES